MIEAKLTEHYVTEWFGPVVGRVAGLLASRGPLSLSYLLQFSKGSLTIKQIKESLFVLLHHSFASYRRQQQTSQIEYQLTTDRINFLIGGFGWLCFLIKQSFPDLVEAFIEVVVMGMVSAQNKNDCIKKLEDIGVLESVESLAIEEDQQIQQPVSPLKKKPKLGNADSQFLRVSMTCLVNIWRRKVLLEYVKGCVNEPAGRVVEFLMTSPSTTSDVAVTFGDALSVDYSTTRPDGRSNAHHYLEVLLRRFSFVQRKSSLSSTRQSIVVYNIDLDQFRKEIREEAFLSTVCRRFGGPSVRIVRYLFKKGPQEDKQLAEVLLMTAKEVRERCFQLMVTGLLHLQEVPRTIDHVPSRTIFLWSARLDIIYKHLIAKHQSAIYNNIKQASREYHHNDPFIREQAIGRRQATILDSFIFQFL